MKTATRKDWNIKRMPKKRAQDKAAEDERSPEPSVRTAPKASRDPPLNGDLLTDEERATPMGLGYSMAATRLNLIYLASIPAMEQLLRDHAKEALTLYKLCQQDALPKSQLYNEVDKITQRLAKVLRGEDPRYMAIPWFTDPNQLRQLLYDQHHACFGDDPEFSGWQADPVREQASYFLEAAMEIVEDATEATLKEEMVQQFNDHVRRHVALFLDISQSLYQYPSEKPGPPPQNDRGATTSHA